jgi:hypothetical protein
MSQGNVEKVERGKSEINDKFPKSVYFILSNVFVERFCTGGIFGRAQNCCLIVKFLRFIFCSNSRDFHQSKTRI